MTNKILNLDISKEPKLNPIIYGRVGDGGSQRVTLNTSKRDEQLDLTGYTITFEGVTSGGKTKVFDSDNVVVTSEGLKKGTFDYVFPNMAFAVKGKYERAYFSFIKDGIRDTSGDFEIIVFGNADINAAEAETVITEYNKLVAELQELQKNNIADLQEQQDTYIQSTDNTFAAIQERITNLQNTIKGFETSVNDTAADVLSTVNQALEELKAGDFYTQLEADARFAKTEDMSAHTENISNPHKVTKAQVQLSNVENYGIATEEEAEAGESSTKYMTPLRVFQAIAKWIGDKFVKKTGDETIAGTKDFQSVPTINGVPVALDTGTAYKEVTVPTDATFNGGTVFFWRIGNLVICSMSFQTKGYVGWKNMIEVPEGFRAQQSAGTSTVLGSSSVAGVFGTIYTSGTNLQVLTQPGAAAGNYKGTLSWYTVQDFPR